MVISYAESQRNHSLLSFIHKGKEQRYGGGSVLIFNCINCGKQFSPINDEQVLCFGCEEEKEGDINEN